MSAIRYKEYNTNQLQQFRNSLDYADNDHTIEIIDSKGNQGFMQNLKDQKSLGKNQIEIQRIIGNKNDQQQLLLHICNLLFLLKIEIYQGVFRQLQNSKLADKRDQQQVYQKQQQLANQIQTQKQIELNIEDKDDEDNSCNFIESSDEECINQNQSVLISGNQSFMGIKAPENHLNQQNKQINNVSNSIPALSSDACDISSLTIKLIKQLFQIVLDFGTPKVGSKFINQKENNEFSREYPIYEENMKQNIIKMLQDQLDTKQQDIQNIVDLLNIDYRMAHLDVSSFITQIKQVHIVSINHIVFYSFIQKIRQNLDQINEFLFLSLDAIKAQQMDLLEHQQQIDQQKFQLKQSLIEKNQILKTQELLEQENLSLKEQNKQLIEEIQKFTQINSLKEKLSVDQTFLISNQKNQQNTYDTDLIKQIQIKDVMMQDLVQQNAKIQQQLQLLNEKFSNIEILQPDNKAQIVKKVNSQNVCNSSVKKLNHSRSFSQTQITGSMGKNSLTNNLSKETKIIKNKELNLKILNMSQQLLNLLQSQDDKMVNVQLQFFGNDLEVLQLQRLVEQKDWENTLHFILRGTINLMSQFSHKKSKNSINSSNLSQDLSGIQQNNAKHTQVETSPDLHQNTFGSFAAGALFENPNKHKNYQANPQQEYLDANLLIDSDYQMQKYKQEQNQLTLYPDYYNIQYQRQLKLQTPDFQEDLIAEQLEKQQQLLVQPERQAVMEYYNNNNDQQTKANSYMITQDNSVGGVSDRSQKQEILVQPLKQTTVKGLQKNAISINTQHKVNNQKSNQKDSAKDFLQNRRGSNQQITRNQVVQNNTVINNTSQILSTPKGLQNNQSSVSQSLSQFIEQTNQEYQASAINQNDRGLSQSPKNTINTSRILSSQNKIEENKSPEKLYNVSSKNREYKPVKISNMMKQSDVYKSSSASKLLANINNSKFINLYFDFYQSKFTYAIKGSKSERSQIPQTTASANFQTQQQNSNYKSPRAAQNISTVLSQLSTHKTNQSISDHKNNQFQPSSGHQTNPQKKLSFAYFKKTILGNSENNIKPQQPYTHQHINGKLNGIAHNLYQNQQQTHNQSQSVLMRASNSKSVLHQIQDQTARNYEGNNIQAKQGNCRNQGVNKSMSSQRSNGNICQGNNSNQKKIISHEIYKIQQQQ